MIAAMSASESPAPAVTQIVQKPDGTQVLVLHRARVAVADGPDAGRELVLEKPAVVIGTEPGCDLQLTDPAVSRQHLQLRATEQGLVLRDLGSTNGTFVGNLRLVEALIVAPVTVRAGESQLQISPSSGDSLEIPLSPRGSFGGLVGQSTEMRRVFAILERVAPTRSTVLLEGESGTGKEVAAQALHQASPCAEGPFVVVDCGAIPGSLMESELFGYERGAFTGAHEARTGALQAADGGTLFLDEIGELPLELQPKLLRFLETQEVRPLGSTSYRKVSVRLVAATNRRLTEEVKEGRFRQDLFFRLSVVRVELPPLRQRPEDILLLAYSFAAAGDRDPRSIISDDISALLASHHWPGNVRELRNVVERLTVLPELAIAGLRDDARAAAADAAPSIGALLALPFHEARRRWQDLFERQYLSALVQKAGGVVARAAAAAGLPRQTFHRLLRQHGLRDGN
jgi:two-component system, NtrC family, nitrogen regulation response regulator GlnG